MAAPLEQKRAGQWPANQPDFALRVTFDRLLSRVAQFFTSATRLAGGEMNDEDGAMTNRALQFDSPAVSVDDGSDETQAETESAL